MGAGMTFRKPFDSRIKLLIVKRFSSMSREELRKRMRKAADKIDFIKTKNKGESV